MIGLGLVGMGYTGWQHLRVVQTLPALEVRAVVETDPARLQGLPPGIAAKPTWQDLLDDPRIEAVSICLPHDLHLEVVTGALAAGRHVLVEKPLALDLPAAERLTAAAAAAPTVTMVEMTHRFYPPVVKARQWVNAGHLGQLVAVSERIVQPVADGELPDWMMQRHRSGGGVTMTNGVHMLDRMAWVSGQPLRLHAAVLGRGQHWGDIEDTASLLLTLADGTPASLLAAWPRGRGATDDELTLYGTAGILRVWAWRGWAFEPTGGTPQVHDEYPADADHAARARVGMAGALAEFAAAIAEGRPARPGFAEILAVQRLIDQVYRQSSDPLPAA